ncbi:hypothetical protein EG834_20900, partial [bacterium]|nr:hypothetical protein [bacterium]
RYWYSQSFGLYEDDLTIIPKAFGMTFHELGESILSRLLQFQGQGRPLHHSLIEFFSWLGWRMDGLWGPYVLGYLIGMLNITMFYALMQRLQGRTFAILASLVYALYPADTTQAFLTHSFGIQPAITLLLGALHAAVSKRRVLAYSLAFLTLFVYETPFTVFLVAPLLLNEEWDRRKAKEFVWHVLVMLGMISIVFLVRKISGEDRVASLGMESAASVVSKMVLGPITALRVMVTRVIHPLRSITPVIGLAMGLSMLILSALLWRVKPVFSLTAASIRDRFQRAAGKRQPFPEQARPYLRLLITGLAMLILAYPLTFTVDAWITNGRNTRVHAAGVVGAAICIGSIS